MSERNGFPRADTLAALADLVGDEGVGEALFFSEGLNNLGPASGIMGVGFFHVLVDTQS